MSILNAVSQPDIESAAYAYLEAGCSIIPCAGKRPALAWEPFTHQRPSAGRVGFWLSSGRLQNIGLVCGAVSGGLVVIDIDSMAACDEFEARFPALLDTLTVRSGSQRGRHYYFICYGNLPANAWRGGIELRSDNSYVVAPPSLHPDSGLAYGVERAHDVKRLATLEPVRRWIIERNNGDSSQPTPAPRTPSGGQPSHIRSSSRYGQVALENECDDVARAGEGSANSRLYTAALRLGSLVAAGHLNQREVEVALEVAASHLSQRDGVEATRCTIASAFKVSLTSPRMVR